MKSVLISDTHYGFSEETEDILRDTLTQMKSEKPDVILHAGDWASTKVKEFEQCVELFREYFPETIIVGVLGNHDLWQDDVGTYGFLDPNSHLVHTNNVFTKHNILTSYTDIKNKISISAMQSWYKTVRPPSNDHAFMAGGREAHYTMAEIASKDYDKVLGHVLDLPNFKHVVVSHFTPFNYRYGYTGMCGPMGIFNNLIDAGVTHLCLGHSHEYQNEVINSTCRVLNCGSDYDEPKFITFDI